jgi:pimeloyl-ACP methyl ester carboxylesterase
MHIVLIPGLWLDASSWDAVVRPLQAAGHRTDALTLPGMESADADRSRVSLADHVAAVVAAVDAVEEPVVVVGHSMGGGLAHAAADARPDQVTRVIYVASEPRCDGDTDSEAFPISGADLPFPGWDFFDEPMTADLDDDLRAAVHLVPSPSTAVTDPVRLHDERRYDVPATMITCEFPEATLREWMAAGEPGLAELSRLRDVEYVDLRCGHWPQFSRPAELAAAILAAL